MTPQTIADLEATRQLLQVCRRRIHAHAEELAKDEALNALTVAGKLITDADALLAGLLPEFERKGGK